MNQWWDLVHWWLKILPDGWVCGMVSRYLAGGWRFSRLDRLLAKGKSMAACGSFGVAGTSASCAPSYSTTCISKLERERVKD